MTCHSCKQKEEKKLQPYRLTTSIATTASDSVSTANTHDKVIKVWSMFS